MTRRPLAVLVGLLIAALTALGAAVAVAAGGSWWSQDSPGVLGAAQAGDFFAADIATGDFNGDGFDDVIAGVPNEDVAAAQDSGRVHVVYAGSAGLTDSGDQALHADSPSVAGVTEAGDRLGTAVAVGDFDGDGYDDAAVGAPGQDVGGSVDAGSVLILYGSHDGVRGEGSQELSQLTPGLRGAAEAHDEFGQSLATGDFDADGFDDLAVGIPGEAIGQVASAGAVQVVFGSEGGLSAARDGILNQNSADVPGSPEPADLFGWALAVADFDADGHDDLAVGVPGEGRQWRKPGAGMVHVFPGDVDGVNGASERVLSQEAKNVLGSAEKHDAFGAALAAGDVNGDGYGDLAVGVPGQAVGSQPVAGASHVLFGSARGMRAAGSQSLTQATPGVRGRAQAGDEFGLEVALVDLDGDGRDDLVVAAPGEGFGSAIGAGAVHAFYGRSTGVIVAGDELWRPGSPGVPGQAQANAGFGRATAGGDLDGDGSAELIVAAPGASTDQRAGSGAFVVIPR